MKVGDLVYLETPYHQHWCKIVGLTDDKIILSGHREFNRKTGKPIGDFYKGKLILDKEEIGLDHNLLVEVLFIRDNTGVVIEGYVNRLMFETSSPSTPGYFTEVINKKAIPEFSECVTDWRNAESNSFRVIFKGEG